MYELVLLSDESGTYKHGITIAQFGHQPITVELMSKVREWFGNNASATFDSDGNITVVESGQTAQLKLKKVR